MRLIKLTLILAGLAAFGAHASARAGTFTYTSYGFSGGTFISRTVCSISRTNTGGAGLITLNGPSTIPGYCVDIADWLLAAGTYYTQVDPASDPKLAGL